MFEQWLDSREYRTPHPVDRDVLVDYLAGIPQRRAPQERRATSMAKDSLTSIGAVDAATALRLADPTEDGWPKCMPAGSPASRCRSGLRPT
jgi:hypothetical protein